MNSFASVAVSRFGADGETDQIVVEEPLEMLVNGRHLSVTMRTPGNDEELAAGFLLTEGIIRGRHQIRSIAGAGNRVEIQLDHDPEIAPRLTMTSACGVCGKTSLEELFKRGCPTVRNEFQIRPEVLVRLPGVLQDSQLLFHRTGGLHAAGLFGPDGTLHEIREDVGRHNAVDKVIGAVLGQDLSNRLILVSGRAGFELVQKAAVAGIPMLAAVGAPTTLAVETARAAGMTLVGFLRDDRFNVYCQPPPSTL
ncbi:MAG TPA: formate dehydrogenase accessory sulfurtransferase FdhD [Bryobacteraceae bacterium]|nr:formate dehydrogenase accessory sulfurtransferase FdhD [Bryobacteraceae bacterium]